MKNFRNLLAGFCVCLLILLPVGTKAQAFHDEEAYRAVLIELIQVLQQQIIVLQAELEKQQAQQEEPREPLSLSDSVVTAGQYKVNRVSDVSSINDKERREYFERVLDIFPDEYRTKIKQLQVYVGDDFEFDAFVETIPPDHKNWLYAVNGEIIEDEDSLQNTELIVHELAHIISYEEIVGVPKPSSSNCDPYYQLHGCPLANSYLGQFAKLFWSDEDLDRVSQISSYEDVYERNFAYYQKHEEDFVTDYAAQAPEEDFAESFMFFVLEDTLSIGDKAQEKIDFFAQYSKLKSVRSEILNKM